MRVYILNGGMVGFDGFAASFGLLPLAHRLAAIKEVKALAVYNWDLYRKVVLDIEGHDDPACLIGFSGGGWRAITASRDLAPKETIKLMVLIDPSPARNLLPVKANVEKTVCFTSQNPLFFGYGGGRATGHNVHTYFTRHAHWTIKFSPWMHGVIVDEVKKAASAHN